MHTHTHTLFSVFTQPISWIKSIKHLSLTQKLNTFRFPFCTQQSSAVNHTCCFLPWIPESYPVEKTNYRGSKPIALSWPSDPGQQLGKVTILPTEAHLHHTISFKSHLKVEDFVTGGMVRPLLPFSLDRAVDSTIIKD